MLTKEIIDVIINISEFLEFVNAVLKIGGIKMAKANSEIRDYAKSHGVHLWEIAEMLGIWDSNFTRKLRRELPAEEQQHIVALIDKIAEGKNQEVS